MTTLVQQTLPFSWQGGRQCSLPLLIEPRICAPSTHYGWVDRGSVEYEVCRTLLHMTSTGNRTPDLRIKLICLLIYLLIGAHPSRHTSVCTLYEHNSASHSIYSMWCAQIVWVIQVHFVREVLCHWYISEEVLIRIGFKTPLVDWFQWQCE